MNVLRSLYFGTMLLVLTLYHALLVSWFVFFYFLIRKDFPTELGHSIGIRWGQRIMALTPGWRVEISGRKHLPKPATPYIIVANHESATDIFSIFLLGIQFKWIAKYELFKIPLLGFAMRKIGYIPIHRGDRQSHKAALDTCKLWIQRGFSVLFFPEGTRSTEGKPKKFKAGAFKLALDTETPLLPVVLSGAGQLLKKGSLCPNPATLKIKILAPIFPHQNQDIEALTELVQEQITKEHEKLSKT